MHPAKRVLTGMLASNPAPRTLSFSSLEQTTLTPQRSAHLSSFGTEPVAFAIGSMPLEVRFSSTRSAAEFAARYADLPAHAGPSVPPSALKLFVVERLGHVLFWVDSQWVWRWAGGPIESDLIGFFADAVLHHELARLTPAVDFHAAVLAVNGACAALTGVTTAGKTTTAVACVRAGLRLYSDERCILQEGRVVPFLRRLTLRAGGRAALRADEPVNSDFGARLASWEGHAEVAVLASRLFGKDSQGGVPLPLRWLFLMDGFGETPLVTPTSALAAAPAILRSFSSSETGLERVALFLRQLRDVDVYRLRLGRPAATANAIKEIMTGAAAARA
ncbi:MAG: hypothetical protein GIX03_10105 [Candidatus Eremiobacteraeota bacterium]|nr:hypothetical protein [Candidatus Eremiobacteraeota bacterium]MBC5803323.1 hypothetical protein [Candidatus Eremiobacteraeota bacterium]MBC5822845.1 hypothetical protein [Candidatus Eremiobacteraeota bacterium]